ncbi:MAG: hypothetical protein FJ217_08775 [Ignavibacteria bacterium]|nr:hypothetical protein [Ignavibacteria bacterium]
METPLMIVFLLVGAAVCWVIPIILGVRAARKRNRSPHWMWLGTYPVLGWIVVAVISSLPPLRECPQCAEKVKAHAKVCRYCAHRFDA